MKSKSNYNRALDMLAESLLTTAVMILNDEVEHGGDAVTKSRVGDLVQEYLLDHDHMRELERDLWAAVQRALKRAGALQDVQVTKRV